ncbi:heavy metal-binding protein HIP-like [Ostrea edulis]|uniref:heavy metal-binding protein HIP-like n=1 Tax=Ostrea edulis TaxID=37623 RepID=UPI0024AFD3FD|nr:heavy metal-binding protein HIP-like [Ostrea edulis]
MKDVLGLAFLLLCAVHIHGLSILTGNSGPNVTQLDTNDFDSKKGISFKQLLNQETIIRIGLVKNVYDLMKDMITMKQSIETASQKTNLEIADLQREVEKLKDKNHRLHLQINDVNKTTVDLKMEVKEYQLDQIKLSSTVSDLEVFRMNMSMNQNDITRKVAFTAGVSSQSTSWNSGTLVFPRVVYNIGGGYDPNTGVFTAPVDGHFFFFVNVQSYGSQYIYTYLVLNGTPKVTTMAYSTYSSGPNLAVLSLQQGDRVWVKHYAGTGYHTESDAPITTFSGFLL